MILLGCQKDTVENLKNQVAELTRVNNIASLENLLLKEKDADNLVTSIQKKNNDEYVLTFENQTIINITQGIVKSIVLDSAKWSASVVLTNNSQIQTNILGKTLDLPLELIKVNPFFISPLSAIVNLNTPVNGKLKVRVIGQDGADSDIIKLFDYYGKNHIVSILGLYPNYNNSVEIIFTDKYNKERTKKIINIKTEALPAGFPSFEIIKQYDTPQPNQIFLLDYRPANQPLMVDRFGKIRWYSTGFSLDDKYALQRLKNGNICYGSSPGSKVVEYSMIGQLIKEYPVSPLYENIHHDVYEMPNGNFLVTVNKIGLKTIEDFILELNRSTGAITNVWDLNLILPRRYTFINAFNNDDWFHTNAVYYDKRDNSIVVSGQKQGVVKVSWDNKLKWILAPPEGWKGYESYFFKPQGTDFEWSWGQHSPVLMPNGNILLFDNGYGREYGKGGSYSRTVEYKIDEEKKTIQQVWQYGKERGVELSSPIISNVEYIENSKTKLMVAGSLNFNFVYKDSTNISFTLKNAPIKCRIVEVDEDRKLLYEIALKTNASAGAVYRAKKMSIYP